MKSHYTIISAVIRPEIQEKISVGLLLVSAGNIHFLWSKNKLSVVRTLIEPPLFKFLTETLRQIENAIAVESADRGSLFVHEPNSLQFSEGYISYMNRYSNNLISLSQPIQIDIPADDKLFQFLYHKYIDATEAVVKKSKSVEAVKADFLPKVRSHFNTEKDISKNEIAGLPMSVNVDMIGKNEVTTFAQIIDFERNLNLIQQDVAVLEFLWNALENKSPKSFLIAAEPDIKQYPKSHTAWADLRVWSKVEYVSLEEIDKIKIYAEEHNVMPLISI